MASISTTIVGLRKQRESARTVRFEPIGLLTATNVQDAISSPTMGIMGVIYGGTEQDISSGASVSVQPTDGMIKINKTTGSPTTVLLPQSVLKQGAVMIVDWKGDAATNNITVNCQGSDLFNGGFATWVIASNGGSIECRPLKDGTGYAV